MKIVDPHAHTPYGREMWKAFMGQCRANGLSCAIVSALGPEAWVRYPTIDDLRGANDLSARFAEYGGETIRWLAYLGPQVQGCEAELDRCLAMGAVGVKIWVAVKSPDGSLDRAIDLVRAVGRRGVAVLIHTFDLTETDPRNPEALTSVDLAEIARACPDTTVVAAHAGGNWKRGMRVLADLPNVVVDISGGNPERGQIEMLLPDLGAERILYGSDFYGRRVSAQLAKVEFASLSAQDREAILWRNAARVFGIENVADVEPEGIQAWNESPPDPAEEHFVLAGDWPWHPAPGMEVDELDAALAAMGVREAWTAPAEGVFRFDLGDLNREFLERCAPCRCVRPLATLAPTACNWRTVVEQATTQGYEGAIVYPYLHGWRLDDATHQSFFEVCARAGLALWVNLMLCDHRFRPPGVGWRPVGVEELTAFLDAAPVNRYVFQAPNLPQAKAIAAAQAPEGGAYRIEVSRLSDFTGWYEQVAGEIAAQRLAFGSEFPLRDLRTVRWTLGARGI